MLRPNPQCPKPPTDLVNGLHKITCVLSWIYTTAILLGSGRVNYQYSDTSDNRTFIHGDESTQILGYATERKMESTISGD